MPLSDAKTTKAPVTMSQICHRCVGEPVLKAEMLALGERAPCDWCGHRANGYTGERLATRVDPVYRTVIGRADEGHRSIGGWSSWGPTGRPPAELMSELIVADDERIGRELVAILAGRDRWGVHDGGPNYYDEQSEEWEFVDPTDMRLKEAWTAFCDGLRHGSRFFTDHAALDEILQPILTLPFARKAIRRITPGGPFSTIYRGRNAHDEAAQHEVFGQPLSQLSSPPQAKADVGRMNAAGISVFYGAFDANTCLAELRVPVGGAAIIARFDVVQPLRVLDLSTLERVKETLSRFDEGYVERLSYQAFLRSFHDELKRAVLPGREAIDYLPTQAVAEYLWTQADPPLDGIIFGSAQISGSHKNIVLFPHASRVEGVTGEPERRVRQMYRDAPHEEGDDRPTIARVILEPLPPLPVEAPRPTSPDDDWFAQWAAARAEPAPLASLRLHAEGLQLVTVTAIRYESGSMPVAIEEHIDDPRI